MTYRIITSLLLLYIACVLTAILYFGVFKVFYAEDPQPDTV